MQIELMRTTGTAQKFTADVWSAITSCDKDLAAKQVHHATRVMRLNDTIQFLQVTDQKRAQEQNTWNANCKSRAQKQ